MTRQPDLVELLHLLGHELRSPAGVMLGYLRMLQEGRFTDQADRLRIYDKMRAALGRLAGLGDAVSQLTSWVEPREREAGAADARELLDRSAAAAQSALDRPFEYRIAVAVGTARLRVLDGQALEAAIAAVIVATARESGDSPVVVCASVRDGREPAVEVVVGPQARVDARPPLSEEAAEEFSIARGGMGLSVVLAIAVLEAHGVRVWSIGGARSLAALRLPAAVAKNEEQQP